MKKFRVKCFALLIPLLVSLSSCSFKKNVVSNDSVLPMMSTRYDWKGIQNNKEIYFKAERGLFQTSKKGVRSISAVTLPVEIPNPIIISNDVLKDVKDRFNFSKSYIQTRDAKLDLPVKISFEESKVTFYVSGISGVIDSKISSDFVLVVELFDGSDKIFSYSYDLRTPPNNVALNFDSDINGSKNGSKILNSFKRIELNSNVYTLIKSVELKNEEDKTVEITFPEYPKANLFQSVISHVYTNLGCNGSAGYTYNANSWNDQLSNGTMIIPLDENTIPSMLDPVNPNQKQIVVLPPNSSKTLGIYSIGFKSKDRLQDNSLKSNVVNAAVLTDCFQKWGECEDHCHGRAGCIEAGNFKVASDNSMYGCQRIWDRHSGYLGIGDERLGLFVQFDDNQNFGTYRFNDHDISKDSEVRSVPIFQSKETVSWNP